MAGQQRGKCLITGASSGIGKSFAEILASRGEDLVLVARRGELLEEQAKILRERDGVLVEVLAADLSAREDMTKVARRIEQGDVAMVINNAGIGGVQGFLELTPEDHERMIAVNVTAVTLLSQAAVRAMSAAGSGTLINVGSGISFNVLPAASVYAGTKAFVAHFTQALAAEFEGKGIRFQALIPGLTRTNLGNAQESGLFDQFPPEMVQSPDAVALASLAGLELGEEVCIPRLLDYSQWEAARDAIRAVGRDPAGNAVAPRYGVAVH